MKWMTRYARFARPAAPEMDGFFFEVTPDGVRCADVSGANLRRPSGAEIKRMSRVDGEIKNGGM